VIMLDLEQQNYNLLESRQQKKILFFLFLCIGVSISSTHAQTKIWLDENHNETTQDKGVYYRTSPEKKRNIYVVVDYYKNGNKYREGKADFTTPNKENYRGIVTYFYSNGEVFKKEKYKDGQLDGPYKEFYPTGELRVDGIYNKGKKERNWKIYYKTGKIKTKGKYRDGKKVGEWTTYYRDVYYPENE